MTLKIGIVTEYYYPLLGGITENVHNTKKRLVANGHRVKVITSNCDGTRFGVHKNTDFSDPDVIRLGWSLPIYSNGSFGYFTFGKSLRTKMKRILDEEQFDIIHLHSPSTPTLPVIAALEAKSAVVGTFHSYFDRSLIYSILRALVQKKIMDRLDGKIGVSKSSIEALNRYFKMGARIIPNGVDTDQFSPSAPRLEKFNDGKINLLFLGRFDPRNGLSLMLRSFEIVKSEYPNIRLLVVGDGWLREYYKRRVPQTLKEDICFLGLARDERPSYYATCDIFCSPVTKASFGVTLLEAMASGKPIVATENIGYRELLSEKEGILVPADDPLAFSKAILGLLKDEQKKKELGKNGRLKAQKYSWDNISRQIADYYQEILGKW